MSNQDYTGRTAVVTGGGRGFGKAFGHALATRGAHVVLADIDAGVAGEAAEEIRAAGGSASAFTCDVADADAVDALMGDTVDRRGGIDILINNAGLHSQAYNEPMQTSGLDKLRRLFDVNVMGIITVTLAAHPFMAERDGACIVNLSSSAAYGCTTAYGVSKLTVRGLTAAFAHEFGGDGIRVNAIAPGLIFTDTIKAELSADTVDYVKRLQILKDEGAESDIVEAMLYLTSSSARFITGETLRVSGGFALNV